MVREHLEAIKAREEEAKAKISRASQEAAAIVDNAKADGESLLDETRIRGSEIKRTMIAEAQKRAGEKIQGLRAENEKKLAVLSDNSRRNRDSALDLILKRFREAI